MTSAAAKAAVVPVESVVHFAGVTKLFVVEDGIARSISGIKTGQEGRGWVEIESGQLPETAQVVTTGQSHLADGTPGRDPPKRASGAAQLKPGRSQFANRRRAQSGRHELILSFLQTEIMTISDICIKRPVFTWVLVVIPVVLGLVSYGELGVNLFPNVDFPVCTVTTVLQGASVEEVEATVTKPIEDIINTVSGIDELRSVTTEGVSVVTVQFLLSKSGDVGMQEVRDKVNTILADLPDGTDPPIVNKFDTGSIPVMTIAVSGRRDFREVTEIAKKQIKERLETVNGVGAINLVGGRSQSDERRARHRPPGRLQPVGRRRSLGARCGKTSKFRAGGSTRARASSSCERWAGCKPSASSTT